MKKLVLLNFCDGLYGGIESFLLNAFFCLDRDSYDVTFLTCGRSTYEMYRDEIVRRGGHVEELPFFGEDFKTKLKMFRALKAFFHRSRPDIVHINSGTLSFQLLAAIAARQAGVKRVILHSHNFRLSSTGPKEALKKPFKALLSKYGDFFLACSTGAARWMFPEKLVNNGTVLVIPNGVDTAKFQYSEEKRARFRQELHLGEGLLIGNIGRFDPQKNHAFMLKIMRETLKLRPDAKLLLVGNGLLQEEIRTRVNAQGLQDKVLFLGERKDMDAFLSAIDVFIFPSIYEGFGIAAVEAEAAGAITILSEAVPSETNVSGSAIYLPITGDHAAETWAEEICKERPLQNRASENRKVYDAGFDVHSCYQRVIEIYRKDFSA